MQFRTVILGSGKTAAGIVVPPEILAALGTSKKPAVRVTVNGHTYRSTVATVSGQYMVGISAEERKKAGVAAGDEVDVDLELDTAPREVALPPDFVAALDADADARRFFATLSYSNKRRIVEPIAAIKTAETRERNIAKAISKLHEGRI